MRLLVVTQKVDVDDAVLGFFHRWLVEFAKSFEQITVICLQKGRSELPSNVKVFSLGKENNPSRLMYVLNFYKYIWQENENYDAVFVHMNQEYVLLAGLIWKLLGKKVFLWRNHIKGNTLTDLAVHISDQVFCTSKGSYTAKFKKTKLMPVGVDSNFFKRLPEVAKLPNSILFLGRISPIKNVEILIKALDVLSAQGQNFTAYIYGSPMPIDSKYFEGIKSQAQGLVQSGKLIFNKEVSNNKTPEIYNVHEISVNLTNSGSFDKTIIEAMMCESIVLVSNPSITDILAPGLLFRENDAADLAQKLKDLLHAGSDEKVSLGRTCRDQAQKHGLEKLVKELVLDMK